MVKYNFYLVKFIRLNLFTAFALIFALFLARPTVGDIEDFSPIVIYAPVIEQVDEHVNEQANEQLEEQLEEQLPGKEEIQADGPVVFFGDSLTEGLAIYKFFTDCTNKGINSLNTISAKEHIDEITALKPSKLFILLGLNDLWGGGMPHDNIIGNYKEIVTRVKDGSPGTKIYIQSIFPVTAYATEINPAINNDIINSVNLRLIELAAETGATYIDVNSLLKDDEGNMASEYSADGAHIYYAYYHIWTDYIKSFVEE